MVLKIALIHLEYFHRITEKFRLQGGSLEVVLTSFLLQIGQLQRNSEDGGFHSRSIYISADLTPTTFAVDVEVLVAVVGRLQGRSLWEEVGAVLWHGAGSIFLVAAYSFILGNNPNQCWPTEIYFYIPVGDPLVISSNILPLVASIWSLTGFLEASGAVDSCNMLRLSTLIRNRKFSQWVPGWFLHVIEINFGSLALSFLQLQARMIVVLWWNVQSDVWASPQYWMSRSIIRDLFCSVPPVFLSLLTGW